MVDGSSPGTSESRRTTTLPRTSRSAPPPLSAERCLRTALTRPIGRPEPRSALCAAARSSMVSPGAGSSTQDEAPPEIRASSVWPGSIPASQSRSRVPAAALCRSGIGWPPLACSQPGSRILGLECGRMRSCRGVPEKMPRTPRASPAAALPMASTDSACSRPARRRCSSSRTRRSGSTAATARAAILWARSWTVVAMLVPQAFSSVQRTSPVKPQRRSGL